MKRLIFSSTSTRATGSVLPFHWFVLAADDGLVVQMHGAALSAGGEGVAHPVGVVPRRVIVAEVGAAALGAGQGAHDEGLGEVDEEAQLDGLGEVVVEDLALVLDGCLVVAVAQA